MRVPAETESGQLYAFPRALPKENKGGDTVPASGTGAVEDAADGHGASPGAQIAAIREGYEAGTVDRLAEATGVPRKRLADALRLPDRTLRHRSKQGQRLTPEESEKVYRVQEAFRKAVAVLESREAAQAWLVAPAQGLGNVSPLDFLDTDLGFQEVMDLLGAIEWGNYY